MDKHITLDLNRIAEVTSRPQDVGGLHFFSPAHVMRLLEVVRGNATSASTLPMPCWRNGAWRWVRLR